MTHQISPVHTLRASPLAALAFAAMLLAGCGGGSGSTALDESTDATIAATESEADVPEMEAERVKRTSTSTTTAAPTATATATTTSPTTSSTTTATAVWTRCAQEDGTCTISGTRDVRYGTATAYVVRSVTNSTACNNATFGDPAVGYWKYCTYSSIAGPTAATSAATTPAPATTTPTPTTPTTTTATAPTTTPITTTPTTTVAPVPVATTPPATTTPAVAGATSASFAGSTADFLNPERGFYVTPKDGEMTVSALTNFSRQYNVSLFLYHINLDSYRNTATLPQSFIDGLNTRFAAGRAAGFKFIVFPHYNYSMDGPDAPLNIALGHIAQLKPMFDKNADVIPFIKAGYVGHYGEWWGSTNGLDSASSKLAIKNAIMANTPATSIVHFRYPQDIMNWHSTPAAAAAARVGEHNDCYMANDTDAHTYSAGLNDSLRAYIKTLTQTGGFGGETCDNVSNSEQRRFSCAQALSEHAAYHVTWLNAGYSPQFISSWKSGGCYDQISRSMGYRLQLDSVNHAPSASKGTSTTVNVNLRNTGWARMFSKRPLVITLRNKSTGATITGSSGDLSTVAAGATAQISVSVNVPIGATAGTYDVQISAPDVWSTTAGDARFAIRFANSDSGAQTWDATAGRFNTGTTVAIQ